MNILAQVFQNLKFEALGECNTNSLADTQHFILLEITNFMVQKINLKLLVNVGYH